jgi:hypothetical protein
MNERTGKAGRGLVIQDVNAPPAICMERIMDLPNYHKFVPKVRKVTIYEENALQNVYQRSNH